MIEGWKNGRMREYGGGIMHAADKKFAHQNFFKKVFDNDNNFKSFKIESINEVNMGVSYSELSNIQNIDLSWCT